MTHSKWIVRLAALVAVTAACSKQEKADDKMTVQGTVSQALATKDVQAVALGADGRSFWSALDARGDFKLSVPVGQAYRIILARTGTDARTTAIAQLAITSANGKTQWVTAKTGTVLRLGQLVPAGTIAKVTAGVAGAVKPATSGSGRGGTDMTDDSADDSADGSGRGGSGRGGSGRGGEGGESESDDHDAYDDDVSHEDDPECHERDKHEAKVCASASTSEMESTRNSAEDVTESCDFSKHDVEDDDDCTGGATGSESTSPADPSSPADPTSPTPSSGGATTEPSAPPVDPSSVK